MPTDNVSRAEKEAWLDEKDKCESQTSFFYFAKFVLGLDLEEHPHRELCNFVQDCYMSCHDGLVLLPRGSYKTTIISQAFPLWVVGVKNHNARVLLDSEVLSNSKGNLDVITNYFRRHSRFRYLWGNQFDPDRSNQERLTVRTRTAINLKEPSVGVASLESVEIGPHWDLIILDDPHSLANTQTKEQIDAVEAHFKLLGPLRHKAVGTSREAPIIVVGTRWCDLDLYGRIAEGYPSFQHLIKSAELPKGGLYFPNVLTQEFLDKMRHDLGLALYSCQYLNNPMPSGSDQPFPPKNFKYREDAKAPKLYICWDPAISESSSACDTALIVGGLDESNEMDVVDYKNGTWPPNVSLAEVEKMYDKWEKIKPGSVAAIAVETVAMQKLFKFDLEAMLKRKGKFIKTMGLDHRKGKAERILAMQPMYEYGAVWHRPWMKSGELEGQLASFPRGRRKDLIDAEADLWELCRPKKAAAAVKSRGDSSTDERIMQAIDKRIKEGGKKDYTSAMGTMW